MPRRDLGFVVLVLALSVMSAFACAVSFVVMQQLSLPRTDLAYGQPLSKTFSDPFVVMIGGTAASVAALVIWPVALVCLWRRDLARCGVFALGLTVLFIIGASLVAPRVALVGSLVVAVAALVFCRLTHFHFFQPHGGAGDVA